MKKIYTDILKQKYNEVSDIELRQPDCYWEWSLITLEKDIEYQQWLGLGGSLTDSSALNYAYLPKNKRKELLSDYYSKDGLNYQFGRLTIGSSDFNSESYSYASKEDLSDFSIVKDKKNLIPLIKDIQKYYSIDFIASPWSPPAFMKENNNLFQGGHLKKENYALYATYLLKYLQSYQKENITIKYMTIQNEPFATQRWESCVWSEEDQQKFIYKNLLPKLEEEHMPTKLLLWDHNKENLFKIIKKIYSAKNKAIAGVGFHWYSGMHAEQLQLLHQKYPELLLFETECCCGFSPYKEEEWLKDAILYMIEIIENIKNGMNAFIDWNILLDSNGGPNHAENYCKSPIILNEEKTDYIKTPIYYFLKHLAIVPVNSTVIFSSVYRKDLITVSFKSPENELYTIVLNPTAEPKECCILYNGMLLQKWLDPYTIVTYIDNEKSLKLKLD